MYVYVIKIIIKFCINLYVHYIHVLLPVTCEFVYRMTYLYDTFPLIQVCTLYLLVVITHSPFDKEVAFSSLFLFGDKT